MADPVVSDLLIGGARIFFDDSSGYRHLGNIPTISLANAVNELSHFTARSGTRRLDKKIALDINLSVKFQLDEFNTENLNTLFLGDGVAAATFTSGSVVDEAATGYLDKYLFTAKGNISSVVITNSAGTITYAVDVDYEIDDNVLGIIKILSGGAITDGQALLIDYDYAASASTRVKIKAGNTGIIEGAARLVFNTLEGQSFQWIIPSCSLRATGDTALSSETWSIAEFELSPLVSTAVSGEPFGYLIVN